MALFDVDFVFSCPCFVSDIQQALFKSTKNYEIAGIVLVESMLLKILALTILRKTFPFLSVITTIFWAVCCLIPKVVFTTIQGFFSNVSRRYFV